MVRRIATLASKQIHWKLIKHSSKKILDKIFITDNIQENLMSIKCGRNDQNCSKENKLGLLLKELCLD